EARGGYHVTQRTERRGRVGHQVLHVVEGKIAGLPTVRGAPESIDPPSRLGEGYADEIASTLPRATAEGHLSPEGPRVARAGVYHRGGERRRPVRPHRRALLVGHAAHRLDDGLEAAPLAPRPGMPEGGERDVHDAGTEPGDLFVAQTEA